MIIDYSNGSPIPAGGITVNGSSGVFTELSVIGQSTGQTFNMDDYTISATTDPATINYQNITAVAVGEATVNYAGTFSTIDELIIGKGAFFIISM